MRFGCCVRTRAVAADDGDLGCRFFGSASEDFGDLGGDSRAAGRTAETLHITLLYKSFSHGTATRLATAATIGAGKCLGYEVDERVFDNLEFLRNDVQDNSKNCSCDTQD